ncbi:hypothetical protein JAAARDRAFT_200321 [Jaapia argillacea MUCL 33604]|uniref:Uncharacterized protein n=1 Tax=Jaapia argillacea MUCL 33604 TaxID=933084 RepID=A0A067P593_9AGAM|nr:hypothetical protein JAAARDRAFT_200321 [Jaapia argillacea MUCL 33604]
MSQTVWTWESNCTVAEFRFREGNDVDPDEPRLIVEALVVRKMSIEEAFLDFGGFEVV